MSAENNKEEKDGTTSPDDRFERKHDPFVNKQDLEVLMEASDVGTNPKKKRFGYGAIILLAVAAKLLIWPAMQTAFYEFKHRSGHGWDDSRADFQKYYEDSWRKLSGALPVKYATDLATCQANGYVAWLNNSGCRKYRIRFFTTAAEHEQKTADCLSNAGEAEFVERNSLGCIKQAIPNQWEAFESVYAERFLSVLQEKDNEIKSDADKKFLADCVAKKYVENLTNKSAQAGSECGPMNLAANDLQALLAGGSCLSAVHSKDRQDQIQKFFETCVMEGATTAH